MKYALIGCGRIAVNHMKAALNNNLDIVAVCDIDKEKMEAILEKNSLQEKKSIKKYIDYKKMIDEEKPELVSIATESGIHAEIALHCIEHGVNVIIEKPMAMSIEDADKIVELTDGFTGADLESTVRDLAYRSIANSNFVLNEKNMLTAFNNVVPLSQTSPEKIEAIRDWGKERAVPASGKPIGGEELSQKKNGPKTRKVLV